MKKLGNEYCPVDVLRRYTEVTNAYSEPNLPIFTPLRFFRSSNLFKLYVLITYIYILIIYVLLICSNIYTFIHKMPRNIQRMSTRIWI